MRNQLNDIINYTGIFETVKISGTADETRIDAWDDSEHLFMNAIMKKPVEGFVGDFAVPNLALLKGLLNFPNYKTDDAEIIPLQKTYNNIPTVEALRFQNTKTGNIADFRLKNVKLLKASEDKTLRINAPKWEVSLTMDASKLAEFEQLVKLYKVFDTDFKFVTRDGNLIATIGDDTSSTHRAEMIVASGVEGELRTGGSQFNAEHFLSVVKLIGKTPKINIAKQGAMMLSVSTDYATYEYFLRAIIKK